ncbi:MAG: ImmA/IrrE family metallo-endopeptidase [Clostridiales bacterium]|nr:ImmA/IrrE family metallo-endopeptidase [Clostridiales bacterium]
MNYKKYQQSRDTGWETLIKQNIRSLPVKASMLVKKEGILLRSYAQGRDLLTEMGLMQSMANNDGFSVRIGQTCYIFYDETCTPQRSRFTILHEYGHILRGDVSETPTFRNREPSEKDGDIETQANIIASRILAPACVLWALDIHAAEDIASLCDISLESAKWRAKRMELLYAREKEFIATRGKSCFLLSPKERAVYHQFLPFIEQVKDRYRRC